ncbi:ABC transporter [Marinobacter fuscus]|uniref:ABC transporter n=1 Tax=Marinobacter fuscus TaxID=2109942 RepID=A0A2T1KQ25_9GAMM|nr:ATP-binding cassette domain-containing protein [Marinobacter fuscus]PSF12138.1 ABC transporter [Marinobacter fuscus]
MAEFDFQGLTASFNGERVIGPLSFQVHRGDHIGLVGKSGAGKSTLIRLLYDRLEAKAALVPQALGLVNALPVFHNVFMGQLDRHSAWYNAVTLVRPFRKDREAVRLLLEELAIPEKQWAPAASLSGGQRQRVAIARAVYRQAPVLLADEPISALDGPMAQQVMAMLTKHFSTSIVAMHDVDLALAHCTRIIGIQNGQIALDAPASEIAAADIATLY